MSKFSFCPKRLKPNNLGYAIKIMGLSFCMTKDCYEPCTVYGKEYYPSEYSIKQSFSQAWAYFCCCEKQIVCCAYDSSGNYKFSFVRDPESKKITKIEAPNHTLPEHMLYYDHKFIPGQSKYPLSLEELDEVRKDLVKSKVKAKKTKKKVNFKGN